MVIIGNKNNYDQLQIEKISFLVTIILHQLFDTDVLIIKRNKHFKIIE